MLPTNAGGSHATPRLLDDAQILATLRRLRARIDERFPGSSLARVTDDVLAIGEETCDLVAYLSRPHWPIRIAAGVAILLLTIVAVMFLASLMRGLQGVSLATTLGGIGSALQASESLLNELVFLGLTVFFLASLEARVKRRRALPALHRLRSLAHIVDMHQLTKDPDQLSSEAPDTASSPQRKLSPQELGRYLDYCSELLSVISKLAALHVQYFNDATTFAAVNDVETLCTGLSNKIWQKITLIDRNRIHA